MKPRIAKSEFEKRIDKIREKMDEQDLDGLFVYGDEYRKENIRYVSNWWPIFERAAVLIGREGEPVIVGAPEGERYAQEMAVWSSYYNVEEFMCVSVPEKIDYPQAAICFLREVFGDILTNRKRLGLVGSRDVPHSILEQMVQVSGCPNIIPADSILEKLRLLKSKAEILCLKEAGRLACTAYEELMRYAIPGNTELYAAGRAEGLARSMGAEAISFTILGSGERSNTIIGRPTQKMIADGDMIMASLAVQYEGYVATAGFPFVAGTISPAKRYLINSLIEAANASLPQVKMGIPMKKFVESVHRVFRRKHLLRYDIYPPLHGCGCAEAESPYPDESTKAPFQENMTVNTDISLFGHPAGSNRIEEGLLVTEFGCESITPLVRHLCDKYG